MRIFSRRKIAIAIGNGIGLSVRIWMIRTAGGYQRVRESAPS